MDYTFRIWAPKKKTNIPRFFSVRLHESNKKNIKYAKSVSVPVTSSFFCGVAAQRGSWPHSWGFLDHTQRRTTIGRNPLGEWSAYRRDLYLITHNTHNRQTSMPRVGFEPRISAGERPQTARLLGPATIDDYWLLFQINVDSFYF
jgi:hypothetical protein